MVRFYRTCVDWFVELAKPQTDMTRKWEQNVLKWSASAEEAYLCERACVRVCVCMRVRACACVHMGAYTARISSSSDTVSTQT